PAGTSVAGFFGFKGQPLSKEEQLLKDLRKDGITPENPDFEILKKEWMANNPDKLRDAFTEEGQFIQKTKEEINAREEENERLTINNEQSLADYRENRKMLKKEQRDRLAEAVKDFKDNPKTQQEKWISSYYDLFDEKKHPG